MGNFFFVRGHEGARPEIKLYINDTNIDLNKLGSKLREQNIDTSIKENTYFLETEGKFGEKGDEILQKFFKFTNEMSLNILKDTLNNYNKKLELALELMIISAHFNYGSITNGYLSYASHVNGFFTRWKDISKIKKIFQNNFSENEYLIKEKLNEIILEKKIPVEFLAFPEILKKIKRKASKEMLKGNLKIFNIEPKKTNSGGDFLDKSEFHKEIFQNQKFYNYMNKNHDFMISRLFTVFTYLLIKNLGIKNKDRYLLCYYIYQIVEKEYNLNTLDLIRNFGEGENSNHVKNY
ncbi:lantibiotic dehydratase C-terminal domain-containing protein [Priestia megaterium]